MKIAEESMRREKSAIVTTKLENRILIRLIVVEIEFELRKNKNIELLDESSR